MNCNHLMRNSLCEIKAKSSKSKVRKWAHAFVPRQLSALVHRSLDHSIFIVSKIHKIMTTFIGSKGFIDEIFTSFVFQWQSTTSLNQWLIQVRLAFYLSLSLSFFVCQSPKDTFTRLMLVKITASRSFNEKKHRGFTFFYIFCVFPIVNSIRKWDDHIWKRILFAFGDEVADRLRFTFHESRAKWKMKKEISTKTVETLIHIENHIENRWICCKPKY